jgi:hypothetical protein
MCTRQIRRVLFLDRRRRRRDGSSSAKDESALSSPSISTKISSPRRSSDFASSCRPCIRSRSFECSCLCQAHAFSSSGSLGRDRVRPRCATRATPRTAPLIARTRRLGGGLGGTDGGASTRGSRRSDSPASSERPASPPELCTLWPCSTRPSPSKNSRITSKALALAHVSSELLQKPVTGGKSHDSGSCGVPASVPYGLLTPPALESGELLPAAVVDSEPLVAVQLSDVRVP